MTAFVVVAVFLVVLALACVIVPLSRPRASKAGIDPAVSNLRIFRDQLVELDRDLAAGAIAAAQYAESRQEIERRVLEEAASEPRGSSAGFGGRWTAAGLAAGLALAASILYLQLGSPESVAPQLARGQGEAPHGEVSDLIERLAARLERQPDEAGFVLLARSYYSLRRYAEAARAFERAGAVVMHDADALADYADALAVAQGGRLSGKPLELALRAMALVPTHAKALALAGTEAFARKDYRGAIGFWERVGGDSPLAQAIAGSIEEARELGNIKPTAKAGAPAPAQAPITAARIAGTVKLTPALMSSVHREDTVFIFARAADGPRIPLAIVRRQVKDLPFSFSLDDSQAMAPNMKLSGAGAVVVGARISKSGDATPKSGDLQGFSGTVKLGATNVSVVIDSVVP